MQQFVQRGNEVRVGKSVRRPAPVRSRFDEPAAPQARELIRHHLTGDPEDLGKVGWVRRRAPKREKDADSGRIGHGVPEPGQRVGMGHRCSHGDDVTGFAELREPCIHALDRIRKRAAHIEGTSVRRPGLLRPRSGLVAFRGGCRS